MHGEERPAGRPHAERDGVGQEGGQIEPAHDRPAPMRWYEGDDVDHTEGVSVEAIGHEAREGVRRPDVAAVLGLLNQPREAAGVHQEPGARGDLEAFGAALAPNPRTSGGSVHDDGAGHTARRQHDIDGGRKRRSELPQKRREATGRISHTTPRCRR